MIPVPEARRSHRYLELPRHLAVGHGDLVQKDGVKRVGSCDSRRLTNGWSWMGASLPRSAGEVLKEDKSSPTPRARTKWTEQQALLER